MSLGKKIPVDIWCLVINFLSHDQKALRCLMTVSKAFHWHTKAFYRRKMVLGSHCLHYMPSSLTPMVKELYQPHVRCITIDMRNPSDRSHHVETELQTIINTCLDVFSFIQSSPKLRTVKLLLDCSYGRSFTNHFFWVALPLHSITRLSIKVDDTAHPDVLEWILKHDHLEELQVDKFFRYDTHATFVHITTEKRLLRVSTFEVFTQSDLHCLKHLFPNATTVIIHRLNQSWSEAKPHHVWGTVVDVRLGWANGYPERNGLPSPFPLLRLFVYLSLPGSDFRIVEMLKRFTQLRVFVFGLDMTRARGDARAVRNMTPSKLLPKMHPTLEIVGIGRIHSTGLKGNHETLDWYKASRKSDNTITWRPCPQPFGCPFYSPISENWTLPWSLPQEQMN